MNNFVIDDTIREQFRYFQNMCSLMSEHKTSSFAPPADIEKIEAGEKEK